VKNDGGHAPRVPARACGKPDLRRRITRGVITVEERRPAEPGPTSPSRRLAGGTPSADRRGEYILVVLLAGFGLIFLLIFPPAIIVNDSWLTLMAGREVWENGLPGVDELTVYGLGST
jgi:hypothetical protein